MNVSTKKVCAFYPYTNEFYSFEAFSHLIKDFKIEYYIVPNSLSIKKTNKNTHNDLPNYNIQQLIIGKDTSFNLSFDEAYFPLIKKAIDRKIDICFISKFSEDEIEKIKEYNNKHNKVKLTTLRYLTNKFPYITEPANAISSFNTPVIFIISSLNKTRKFEVELSLFDNFSKKKYKPLLVSSKPYAELFGAYPFPYFSFLCQNEVEKIINMNMFFKSLEYKYQPDIIIVGIPGPIGIFSNKILNNFGITMFEASRAIPPDIVVLNINYDNYDTKSLENLTTGCQLLTGIKPNTICIADTQVDPSTIPENQLNYFYISEKKVDHLVTSLTTPNLPVFSTIDCNSLLALSDFIEKKLLANGFSVI